MPKFKLVLIAIALFGVFSATASAEFVLAKRGIFTIEDGYAQMGGMPFELSTSLTNFQTPQRVASRS